jgi:hypothetical protein
VAIELLGVLPLLLLVALAGWQILLAAFTATSAQDAARTGSRAAGIGRDGSSAATDALSPWLRGRAHVTIAHDNPQHVTVKIDVPILVPGLTTNALTVTRTAELPSTVVLAGKKP